jgi:hypothetical protein
MNALDTERKYLVEGWPEPLPYTLAKKATRFPEWCVSGWHTDANAPRPTARDSNLCYECTDILRASWSTIADCYGRLLDGLHPVQSFSAGERVSGGGGLYPPLPINADVSDLLREIRESVWSTVQGLIEDRPEWKMPADPTVDVLADNLARWHTPYVASHPRAGHSWAVLREVHGIAERVSRAVTGLDEPEVQLAPQCGKTVPNPAADPDDENTPARLPCPGQVVAVGSMTSGRQARCTHDGTHTVPIGVWMQVQAAKPARRARVKASLTKKYSKGLTG